MKNLLWGFCLSLAGITGGQLAAQSTAAPESNYLFKNLHPFRNLKCETMLFDAGYMQGNSHGIFAPGFTMTIGGRIGKYWGTGLRMDIQQDRRTAIVYPMPVLQPALSFAGVGWNNELLIAPDRILNGSLSLLAGGGFAAYHDQGVLTTYYNGSNWVTESRKLGQAAYLLLEPGANVYVNLFRHFSLGCGAGYRLVSGSGFTGNGADFSGLTARAMIRMRFSDEECK